VITDPEITLRRIRASDVDTFVAELNEPDIARFMILIPQPYTEADATAWVERCEQVLTNGSADPYAIADVATGDMLGVIEISPDGSVGYWVSARFRGRGIATRALSLLCDAHPGRRLWLTTHPENGASQRVAVKAGFRRTGVVSGGEPFRDGTTKSIRFERG
jgi:RimJ/RimL family protein N-acetyltransferase